MNKSRHIAPFHLLAMSVLLVLSSCGGSSSDSTTYAFQMGKMTGSNPSYFRIALTLYTSIVEFPSSSSSSSSPVSTSSSSSSSSSSSEISSSSSSFSSSEVTSSETTSTVSTINSYA